MIESLDKINCRRVVRTGRTPMRAEAEINKIGKAVGWVERFVLNPTYCPTPVFVGGDICGEITSSNYYNPDSTSPNQSKKSIFIKAPLLMYKWAI